MYRCPNDYFIRNFIPYWMLPAHIRKLNNGWSRPQDFRTSNTKHSILHFVFVGFYPAKENQRKFRSTFQVPRACLHTERWYPSLLYSSLLIPSANGIANIATGMCTEMRGPLNAKKQQSRQKNNFKHMHNRKFAHAFRSGRWWWSIPWWGNIRQVLESWYIFRT